MRSDWFNLANGLTSVRILLTPVLIVLLLRGSYEYALWTFLAAGLSDALDGLAARYLDQMTRFGALLDPIADKLVLVSTAVILTVQGLLPFWLVALIVARDVIIVAGALSFRLRFGYLEIAPLLFGKASTATQIGLILLVLVQAAAWLDISAWLPAAQILTGAVAVISGAQYVAVWGNKARRGG